jgi:hypothetical protein
MANPVPAGSDVSSGTYKCTNCGNQLEGGSTKHLRHAPRVATANMKRFQAATASKIRIPTASVGPRRRPSPTLRAAL